MTMEEIIELIGDKFQISIIRFHEGGGFAFKSSQVIVCLFFAYLKAVKIIENLEPGDIFSIKDLIETDDASLSASIGKEISESSKILGVQLIGKVNRANKYRKI